MADKPNAFHTLGLEITHSTLKGAKINLRKGKPELERLYEIPIQPDLTEGSENVKPLYTSEEGQALLNALPKTLPVTLLNPGETLARQLEVKLKKIADVDAVLAFQAEPLLPYPVDQALVDRVILGTTED